MRRFARADPHSHRSADSSAYEYARTHPHDSAFANRGPGLAWVSARSVLEAAAEAAETVESYHSELDVKIGSAAEEAKSS